MTMTMTMAAVMMMMMIISTFVCVLDGVDPLPRVRSIIASTRLRRAMRSSSSFFSRSFISRRILKIHTVLAVGTYKTILLLTFTNSAVCSANSISVTV